MIMADKERVLTVNELLGDDDVNEEVHLTCRGLLTNAYREGANKFGCFVYLPEIHDRGYVNAFFGRDGELITAYCTKNDLPMSILEQIDFALTMTREFKARIRSLPKK